MPRTVTWADQQRWGVPRPHSHGLVSAAWAKSSLVGNCSWDGEKREAEAMTEQHLGAQGPSLAESRLGSCDNPEIVGKSLEAGGAAVSVVTARGPLPGPSARPGAGRGVGDGTPWRVPRC